MARFHIRNNPPPTITCVSKNVFCWYRIPIHCLWSISCSCFKITISEKSLIYIESQLNKTWRFFVDQNHWSVEIVRKLFVCIIMSMIWQTVSTVIPCTCVPRTYRKYVSVLCVEMYRIVVVWYWSNHDDWNVQRLSGTKKITTNYCIFFFFFCYKRFKKKVNCNNDKTGTQTVWFVFAAHDRW